jgi:hypothetical protein
MITNLDYGKAGWLIDMVALCRVAARKPKKSDIWGCFCRSDVLDRGRIELLTFRFQE